ncbi:hypothetical protein SAMN04490248_103133 [Salinihabitans flavidus]|uniref:Uncharacterized protein n=1 Tax=Salinihabitans flavidus TaxID=569882 RepID=A0A1H8NDY7_9RHOB|nr:hypothetical protein [Salinihabitans flavidus]SEO27824.1 hypothetical protein SAMN04490248_103133 [Salinihabitans flavidus]
MLTQFRSVIRNAQPHLVQDVLGGVALMVLLVVALHLPGLS